MMIEKTVFIAVLLVIASVCRVGAATKMQWACTTDAAPGIYCWYSDESGEGVFTVDLGSHPMKDYSPSDPPPWKSYINNFKVLKLWSNLGEYALAGAQNLERVETNTGMYLTVGKYAFANCGKLKSVRRLSSSSSTLYQIEDHAFENCTSLSDLDFKSVGYTNQNDVLTKIGMYAFRGCTSLKSISFPNPFETLDIGAFKDSGLTQLPDLHFTKVTEIRDEVFENTEIETAVIDSYTTRIGANSFKDCKKLKKVVFPNVFPNENFYVGNYAFEGCTVLDTVIYDKSQRFSVTLGVGVFRDTALTTITVPESVKQMGSEVFQKTKVKNLSWTMPYSSSNYGDLLFWNCQELTDVYINSTALNGFFSMCSSLSNVTFGSGFDMIGTEIFANCTSLKSVYIPGGNVREIEPNTFIGCTGLETVALDYGVKEVAKTAFADCTSIQTVYVLDSTAKIGVCPGSGSGAACSAFTNVATIPNLCVPPDFTGYVSGFEPTHDTEVCKSFRRMFNQCYYPSMEQTGIVEVKRENTTEWESRTNRCYTYTCDRDEGPKKERSSQASSYEQQSKGCVRYFCNETGEDKQILECNTPPLCHEAVGTCNEAAQKCEYTKLPGYDKLKKQENQCYEVACDGKSWALQQNATNYTVGCVFHFCGNETGVDKQILDCKEAPACHEGVGTCNEETEECEYSKIPGYDELKEQEDECHEVVCDGTAWILRMREESCTALSSSSRVAGVGAGVIAGILVCVVASFTSSKL